MTFGRVIVDTAHDTRGNRVLWSAMPPLLYRMADNSTRTAREDGAVAVAVLAVVPGRGGPQWWRLVAGEPQDVGDVTYED